MSEIQLEASFPLDQDGFISRECPFCKMRFKVEQNDFELRIKEMDEIFCPYCGQSADTNEFWTPEQNKYMMDIVNYRVLEPEFEKLERNLKRTKHKSDLFSIDFSFKRDKAKKPIPPEESNNMIIINFPCCKINIKIEDSWNKSTSCILCGTVKNSLKRES